ncbi:pentatricopeptide repeat protein [Phlyctema vagabunda]|uniref:Pentatricopeptide repeat protein n=1 Tax=Phlyctema vagabunda TaxID=108571 RepID=A0ABR4PWR0_9HELO
MGQCYQHKPADIHRRHSKPQRPRATFPGCQMPGPHILRRQQHTQPPAVWRFNTNRTKEELMALVDQYDGTSFTDQLPLLELPTRYQPSDGPHLTVSDRLEDEWPALRSAWPCDKATKDKIKALETSIKDRQKDPEDIFKLYRDLPEPRVPYLEANTRHRLLNHLSIVERKDEHSMMRYFSILDDMKVTAIPLSVHEWTSAISFASRYVSISTDTEVEAALLMWREMEHEAGVKANSATFNVLFDVACKAGKFTLAEMIYKEMGTRRLEYNRYHHVSRITFYGLKGDGDGVRLAYKELVEANEVVDTIVLNAMITSLIKCHEEQAAEHIYERMKRITLKQRENGKPVRQKNYKDQREITRTLMTLALRTKQHRKPREENDDDSDLVPNLQTFRILLNHSAISSGELYKATQFLDEMKWFDIPLHGAMFLILLKGFALHGGTRYTQWTEARLNSVWGAFLRAVEENEDGLYISRWTAIWALRAFAKCSGKSAMIDVWENLRQTWAPGGADLEFILNGMRPLLEADQEINKQDQWMYEKGYVRRV